MVALMLICLMLHVWLPDDPTPMPQTPFKPDKPRRKRPKEPKPFAGLIHKHVCDACAQAVDAHPKTPAMPPPVLTFPRGRPRLIDTQPTAVRTKIVPITDGSDVATFAPMAILAVAPGGSCNASRVTAISISSMARHFMVNASHSTNWYGRWPRWPVVSAPWLWPNGLFIRSPKSWLRTAHRSF